MMRRRDAPSDRRMPISRCRDDAAGEQEIGDVRAPDHQDESERKEQRREHHERFQRLRNGPAPRHEHDVGRRAIRRAGP